MKLSHLILLIAFLSNAVSCTCIQNPGRTIYTPLGSTFISNDQLLLSSASHVKMGHKALLKKDNALAYAHSKVALEKDNYSVDARRLMENADTRPSYFYITKTNK